MMKPIFVWQNKMLKKINPEKVSNGQLTKSGTYILIKGTTMFNIPGDRIIYDGVTWGPKVFITIKNDMLTFTGDGVDGGASEYKRIK